MQPTILQEKCDTGNCKQADNDTNDCASGANQRTHEKRGKYETFDVGTIKAIVQQFCNANQVQNAEQDVSPYIRQFFLVVNNADYEEHTAEVDVAIGLVLNKGPGNYQRAYSD